MEKPEGIKPKSCLEMGKGFKIPRPDDLVEPDRILDGEEIIDHNYAKDSKFAVLSRQYPI